MRTWIAAFATLGAAGPYTVRSSFYRPIPEWIAGFATVTAVPQVAAALPGQAAR